MATIKIDPVTRIEGHLKIEVEVDSNNVVTHAKSTGNLFRGFEKILQNRDPRDAVHITQRICGLCPVSHNVAAVKAVEEAFSYTPSHDAALTRSLILGGNYLSDHVLHFYHLTLLDYAQGPQMGPWTPDYGVDQRFNQAETEALIGNYVKALEIRRKAHEMTALLSGKIPHVMSSIPGGVTQKLDSARMNEFMTYLTEVKSFIDNFYIPDAQLLASRYNDYYNVGSGVGNLLAFGVFDLDSNGNKLFNGGTYIDGSVQALDESKIREYTKHSWYTNSSSGAHPASGTTEVDHGKADAYSWLKSPRYDNTVFEVGPVARMKINGHYTGGTSVMDRHIARAEETKMLAEAMVNWTGSVGEGPHYDQLRVPRSGVGVGLTEAPRGALGHWLNMSASTVDNYQIITPTCWNASPKDDLGQSGALEQALIGTAVSDPSNPVELLRVIHSLDPCTGCSVHIIQPETGLKQEFVVSTPNPSGLL